MGVHGKTPMAGFADSISAGFTLVSKGYGRLIGPTIVAMVLGLAGLGLLAYFDLRAPASGLPRSALPAIFAIDLLVGIISAFVTLWLFSEAFGVVRGKAPAYTLGKVGWLFLFTVLTAVVSTGMNIVASLIALVAALGLSLGLAFILIVGSLSVIVIIGLMLVYVYFTIRLTILSELTIVDSGLNPFAAIGRAWRLSRGRFWEVFLIVLVAGALNMAGMLVIGLGLLYTIPVSALILTHYYDSLVAQAKPKRASKAARSKA